MTGPAALARLAALKTTYGPGTAAERLALVRAAARGRCRTAAQVTQLHELLCYAHAYPDDEQVFAEADRHLRAFHTRPDLRAHAAELVNSGIAGTAIVYPFGFSTARWLAERWGDRLTIDWDALGNADAFDTRLHLASLWSERPVFDEPPHDGRAWLDRLRGRETDAAFVIRRSQAVLPPGLVGEYLYDELGLTVRVAPGETTPRRTGARLPGHPVVTQPAPLRTGRPDLRQAVTIPPRRVRSLSETQAAAYLDLARASMVTRSRDLYTFTAANLRDARLIDAGGIAQIPLRGHLPVPVEAMLAQWLIGEATANGALGHYDDGLLQTLVIQLVQRDKHQGAGLARCGWRFDQQVLFAALGIGTFLHGAHAQLVGLAGCSSMRCSDGYRRHRVAVGRVGSVSHCDSSSMRVPSPGYC